MCCSAHFGVRPDSRRRTDAPEALEERRAGDGLTIVLWTIVRSTATAPLPTSPFPLRGKGEGQVQSKAKLKPWLPPFRAAKGRVGRGARAWVEAEQTAAKARYLRSSFTAPTATAARGPPWRCRNQVASTATCASSRSARTPACPASAPGPGSRARADRRGSRRSGCAGRGSCTAAVAHAGSRRHWARLRRHGHGSPSRGRGSGVGPGPVATVAAVAMPSPAAARRRAGRS